MVCDEEKIKAFHRLHDRRKLYRRDESHPPKKQDKWPSYHTPKLLDPFYKFHTLKKATVVKKKKILPICDPQTRQKIRERKVQKHSHANKKPWLAWQSRPPPDLKNGFPGPKVSTLWHHLPQIEGWNGRNAEKSTMVWWYRNMTCARNSYGQRVCKKSCTFPFRAPKMTWTKPASGGHIHDQWQWWKNNVFVP